MAAVLLFSAVVHVAAVALAAALVLQLWLDKAGRAELATPDLAWLAGKFGVGVGLFVAILSLLLYPFGRALAVGIAVGLLAALMLILFVAVRPMAPSPAGRPWHRRPHSLLFYGTFAAMELVAFVFLVSQLGSTAASG